jgi:hypothetical protein
VACSPAAGRDYRGFKAIDSRKRGGGSLVAALFQTESDMDAKTTHELVLLVAIALLSGTAALAVGHVVFAGVFAALGIAATLNAWHRS